MTTGAGRITLFVDTNVLVYASLVNSPLSEQAQNVLRSYKQAGADIWISGQVIREFLATLTRPQVFAQPASAISLRAEVELFTRQYHIAEDNADVTEKLLQIVKSVAVGGKQVHDANIVATMQVYGVTHLLTHNVSDFTRYSKFITVISLTAPQ
ncbi:MAG TPA: PIN domain-containing protein [Chloroflexia bacterium]|jgi:predicted nucleic acid-binding protein